MIGKYIKNSTKTVRKQKSRSSSPLEDIVYGLYGLLSVAAIPKGFIEFIRGYKGI